MNLKLLGKRVLITCASQGIGEGLASVFAEEGSDLHLVARSGDKLQAVAERLRKEHGIQVVVQEQDIAAAGAAEAIREAAWRKGWEVKVFGYIDICRSFYASMKIAGGGVILNNIGNGGENFDFRYIAGSTGNAALMAFTRALGGRSLDDGIRVLGINPGPVATDRIVKIMRNRATEQWGDESRYAELLAAYPLGRAASVREVADL